MYDGSVLERSLERDKTLQPADGEVRIEWEVEAQKERKKKKKTLGAFFFFFYTGASIFL